MRSDRETKVRYSTGGKTTCGTQTSRQKVALQTLWRSKFGFWSIFSVFAPVRADFTGRKGGGRQRRARKRMIQFFSGCPRVSNGVRQFSKSLVHENRQILSQLRAKWYATSSNGLRPQSRVTTVQGYLAHKKHPPP